jgi:uncharacterized membrane protein
VDSAVWPTNAPPTVGPLAPGESSSIDIVVSIPLDALAGAGDYSSIGFSSALPGTLPATANLGTIANAVYGLQITAEADSLEALASGVPLTYTLTVTNLGNITDTFNITVSSTWAFDAPLTLGPLPAGESALVTIVVYVPSQAHSGDVNLAIVTLTSQGNPIMQQMIDLTAHTAWYNLFMPMTVK